MHLSYYLPMIFTGQTSVRVFTAIMWKFYGRLNVICLRVVKDGVRANLGPFSKHSQHVKGRLHSHPPSLFIVPESNVCVCVCATL